MARRRTRAGFRFHRRPAEDGPPYGLADLPGRISAGVCTVAGPDPKLGECAEGDLLVTATAYVIRSACTWDRRHPLHAAALAAHRHHLADLVESGYRVALALTTAHHPDRSPAHA